MIYSVWSLEERMKQSLTTLFQLKCSGEQTGCQRCVARGVDCQYTEALYKKGARQGRTASVSKSNANVSIRRTEQDFLSPTPIPTPSEGDNTYDASSNDFSRSLLTNSTKSHSNQQVSYCQDDSNGTDVFELPNDLLDGLSDPRVGATFLSSSDRTPELDGIWQSTSDSTLCNYALIDDDYHGSYLDRTRTGTASLSDADFSEFRDNHLFCEYTVNGEHRRRVGISKVQQSSTPLNPF